MAEFVEFSSQRGISYLDSEKTFVLDPGAQGDIILTGIDSEAGEVRIGADDPNVLLVTDAPMPPTPQGFARRVSLLAKSIGQTTLGATTPSGVDIASTTVAVGFTPGPMQQAVSFPYDGSIPLGIGAATQIRIPVPGTNGLCLEFRARGWTPLGGSTSTIFVQDMAGKRQLRLDYGPNPRTGTVDYHWNHDRVFKDFGIQNHTPLGRAGSAFYRGARYFRYAGRVLVVVSAAIDVYSIVVADQPLRQAVKVVSGWAGAWVGCKVIGAGGAWVGTAASPGFGTAIGGATGCIVGAFIGYEGASRAAGRLYDWGSAHFSPVPELPAAP